MLLLESHLQNYFWEPASLLTVSDLSGYIYRIDIELEERVRGLEVSLLCTYPISPRSHRTRLDLLHPAIDKRICEKQSQQKSNHDKNCKMHTLQVGDKVMIKNFHPGPKWIPGTIAQQDGPLSSTACTESGRLWKRRSDHLKLLKNPQGINDTLAEMPIVPPTASLECHPSESAVEPSTEETTTETTTVDTEPRYPRRYREPPERFVENFTI